MFMPAPMAMRMTTGQVLLAAEHVAEFRDLIVDLVHAHADEVGEHDLGDRAQPGQRRAAAAPTIADSEMGVSRTRPSPNLGSSPLVTPKIPPDASRVPEVPPAPPETSSPSTMTRSSRAISCGVPG